MEELAEMYPTRCPIWWARRGLVEIKTAEIMEKNHFGINLGFGKDVSIKKISDEINDLILNYDLRVKMNLNGKKLVDGKGSKRVVSVLEDICRQK